jgi:hypothetical protein
MADFSAACHISIRIDRKTRDPFIEFGMSRTQKLLVAAALAVAVGTSIYQSQQASVLRAEVRNLQAAFVAPMSLEPAPDNAQVAALQSENEQLKRNNAELPKLRAEVTRLKAEVQATSSLNHTNETASLAAKNWLNRLTLLKDAVSRRPEANVPELRLLNEEDWLSAVKDPKLETEKDFRRAMSQLRATAQNRFAGIALSALSKFQKENKAALPTDMLQLQPYLSNNNVDAEVLQRFAVLPASEVDNVKMGGEWIISQAAPIDSEFDMRIVIGPSGYGSTSWNNPKPPSKEDLELLKPALNAFNAENGGIEPSDPGALKPFLKTKQEHEAYERVLQGVARKEQE